MLFKPNFCRELFIKKASILSNSTFGEMVNRLQSETPCQVKKITLLDKDTESSLFV